MEKSIDKNNELEIIAQSGASPLLDPDISLEEFNQALPSELDSFKLGYTIFIIPLRLAVLHVPGMIMGPTNLFVTSFYGDKPYRDIIAGFRSTFDLGSLERQLDLGRDAGEKTPTLKLGFDSRVFTRAHRLLPEKAVKILCPMPHFNASSETAQLESYLGDVQYHQQYVWNELGDMICPKCDNLVQQASPEFKQLAAAFFGGQEVDEECGVVYKPPKPTDLIYSDDSEPAQEDENYNITFGTSERFNFLDGTAREVGTLAVFLVDSLMSASIEKMIDANSTYKNMKVSHSTERNYLSAKLDYLEDQWNNGKAGVWEDNGRTIEVHPNGGCHVGPASRYTVVSKSYTEEDPPVKSKSKAKRKKKPKAKKPVVRKDNEPEAMAKDGLEEPENQEPAVDKDNEQEAMASKPAEDSSSVGLSALSDIVPGLVVPDQDTSGQEVKSDTAQQTSPPRPVMQGGEGSAEAPRPPFTCSCCGITRRPTTAVPMYFCSFCGRLPNIRYCSRACLLADAFDHAGQCANIPESQSITNFDPPSQYVYDKDALFTIQELGNRSRELHRQKTFSMYCFSGPFPEVCNAWMKKHESRAGTYPADFSEEASGKKITGDYHVFRSEVSTPGQVCPSEVLTTFNVPAPHPFKFDFNRLLNACFTIGKLDRSLVVFLYRIIRDWIYDDSYYRCSTPGVPREIIWPEFCHQFKQEFGVEVPLTHEPPKVNMTEEWPAVHDALCMYEASFPQLLSGLYGKLE